MPDRYLSVDMDRLEVRREPLPEACLGTGGRGFIAAWLDAAADPTLEPLGPDNPFLIANGLLAGTGAPCSGRVSVGCKSPLTGTIKEANAGGGAGLALARLGLRAVVVRGTAAERRLLVIGREKAWLESAAPYAGLGTYRTCERLRTRWPGAAVLCVGPAGERGSLNATVQVTDMQGRPARAAARGGVGTVMAARGLKAVVLLDDGDFRPVFADKARFQAAMRAYVAALRAHPGTGVNYPRWGTALLVESMEALGALPTRNFSEGRFEGHAGLSAERMDVLQAARGGTMRHICQPGCPIGCSNVYHGPDGAYLTSGFEYETIALNGSNLGIGDLDVVAAIDRLCDDAGLDTMETGATLGVAMEAGLAAFGDAGAALDLARQLAEGSTPLGREMALGTERFGRLHGVRRLPVVKGQAMAGYDPRAAKGTGVTYATSTMGADHTAGNTMGNRSVSPLRKEGQVKASREAQRLVAVFDSLGMCLFSSIPASEPAVFALVGDMLAGLDGGDWPPARVAELGKSCLARERRFNARAGITPDKDDIPAFMREEPLAPHQTVFDIGRDELQGVRDDD